MGATLETADELVARAYDLKAEANALLARAARMRTTVQAAPAAVVAVRVVAAELDVKPRVLLDAGRRGELRIDHAGRTPVVSRAEVERWIAGRRRQKTGAPTISDARQAARSAAAARAAR